MKLARS
jgi:hypothetical protein